MVSLSNYFICICIFFFVSNFMKSSAVYEASLCLFVVRFETTIGLSMKFDISLQYFSRYLLTANVIILAVERKL